MTIWTLYQQNGLTFTCTGPLKLTYEGAEGVLRAPGGQLVSHCDCVSSDDEVTVEIMPGSSDAILDPSRTQVTRAPVTALDAIWSVTTTNTVLLTMRNPAHRDWWSWEYGPIISQVSEPIALKIKVRIKRPPTEDRHTPS